MQVVFMGNPIFAVPSLQMLYDSSHSILAVVTNPDKDQGRGRTPKPTPIALFAREKNIPLIQPDSLKEGSLAVRLQNLNPELFVVVAYKILPSSLLQIPRFGCVNLHGSILPKYRGAAPIQWALMNGDSKTGLTTFILAPKVDTGDILLKQEVVIYPDDNFGSLSHRMAYLGSGLLKETLDRIEKGNTSAITQDSSLATKAPKIKPDMCLINWERSARHIRNQIRALSPSPGAYTLLKGKRLKLFQTKISNRKPSISGEIVSIGKERFSVSCGEGSLDIFEVQLEGKRRMTVNVFLQGFSLSVGERFGSQF